MSVVATAVTVSERQLPFQNGTYRSRTAYAMVCQWSRWHMPQANKRSRPYCKNGLNINPTYDNDVRCAEMVGQIAEGIKDTRCPATSGPLPRSPDRWRYGHIKHGVWDCVCALRGGWQTGDPPRRPTGSLTRSCARWVAKKFYVFILITQPHNLSSSPIV